MQGTITRLAHRVAWHDVDGQEVKRWPSLSRRFSALAGPFVWALGGGYLRSGLAMRPVDGVGNPIPWMAYPAVDFMASINWSDASVAEVGSGNSTRWWAERAGQVVAFELHGGWAQEVRERTARYDHVALPPVSSDDEIADALMGGTWDVIVVDGFDRPRHVRIALDRVRPDGLVIVDNSNEAILAPVLREASGLGWLRVDFVGHSADSLKPTATSMLFRPACRWLRNIPPPRPGVIRRSGSPPPCAG